MDTSCFHELVLHAVPIVVDAMDAKILPTEVPNPIDLRTIPDNNKWPDDVILAISSKTVAIYKIANGCIHVSRVHTTEEQILFLVLEFRGLGSPRVLV